MAEKVIDTDISSITLVEAKKALELFISLRRPVFLHGPVGVGKSDLIAQLGKENNRKVIDLRMSQLDISDLRGIPFFNTDTKKMEWAPPCTLPTDPSDNSILFLDELNCASPAVQATAYQLILDRKVGDYHLPEGVSVIAAGNRDKDRGSTFKIATPLLNRFVHLDIKYDFKAWKKWAEVSNIHETVLRYLTDYESDLTSFDPKSNCRAFATPRSWKYVSDCMHTLTNEDAMPEKKILHLAISACIGDALATKFTKWFFLNGALNVDDVLSGKVTTLPKAAKKESMSFIHNFSHELGARLKTLSETATTDQTRNLFNQSLNNAFTFLVNNSEGNKEIPLSFVTVLYKKYGITINQEKVSSMQEYLDKPGVAEFIKTAALNKFKEIY